MEWLNEKILSIQSTNLETLLLNMTFGLKYNLEIMLYNILERQSISLVV